MFIPKKKVNRNEAETRADHIDPRLEFHGWEKTPIAVFVGNIQLHLAAY